MSSEVHWSLSSLLLGQMGVRLLIWFGGILLKFGNSLLIGLLPLIGLLCGELVGDWNNTLAGFSCDVSILSWLVCSPIILSKI